MPDLIESLLAGNSPNKLGIVSGVSKNSRQKTTHVLEPESEHTQIKKMKIKFVSLLQKFDPEWHKNIIFRKNRARSIVTTQIEEGMLKPSPKTHRGIIKQGSERDVYRGSNFFHNRSLGQNKQLVNN